MGAEPVFIFAHSIVYDSALRWGAIGGFVRTMVLCSFSDVFVFQTINTTYLLLDDGLRKRTDLKTLELLV